MSEEPTTVRVDPFGAAVPPEFLYAKLHGRRGRLREMEDLRELARADSVGQLAQDLFPRRSVDDQFALELLLQGSCVEELAFFVRYVGGAEREFYEALLDRFRVENLKLLLRVFLDGERAVAHRDLVPLPGTFGLPVERLLDSSGLGEFLRRIPLPEPRRRAQQAAPLYRETERKAFLEMALDAGYWDSVGGALEALPRGSARQCAAPVRHEFDAARLVAVLRAARVYDLRWERMEVVLPDGWGLLSTTMLQDFFRDPDPQQVLDRLASLGTGYRLPLQPEEAASVTSLEEALWHETVGLAEDQFRSTQHGFVTLVAYFYLKLEELRHLLSLTQMVRRGMGRQRISEFLQHGQTPGWARLGAQK